MGPRLAVLALVMPALLAAGLSAQTPSREGRNLSQHLADARRLVGAGDYQGAIGQLRQAVRIDPRSAEAYDLLGHCYLNTAQLRYAVEAFTSALALDPSRTSSRRGLGLAQFQLGHFQDCLDALRPAIAELGRDPQVQRIYGQALLAVGQPEAALAYLRLADIPGQTDASLRLAIARAYQAAGDAKSAELYFRRVLQLEPTHRAAQQGLVEVYQADGRHVEARQLLQEMLRQAPNDPLLLARLAETDQALGLTQEALQIYERMSQLAQGTSGVDLHITLAETYMARQQADLAWPHYQAAVSQRPGDARLRAALARCLRALGQRAEAAEQYQAAVRLDPSVTAWHFERGGILEELGRTEEALHSYEAGLALDPLSEQGLEAVARLARELDRPGVARDALISLAAGRPEAESIRLTLSDVYRELGDLRSADVQAWEVLRVDPRSVEARGRLAQSDEELGDFVGAVEQLRTIEALGATDSRYLSALGRLLAAQGHFDEAIAQYEALRKREPGNTLALSDLAALYVRTRQTAKARALLQEILAASPDSPWALDRLARCEELDGEPQRALLLRRRVAQAAPDDRDYLSAVTRAYEEAGRGPSAIDFLITLMLADDPPVEAVRAFTDAYRREAGTASALEQIRGLADIFVSRPVFERVAAETCAAEGLRDEAILRFQHYLMRRPHDYEAVASLVALSEDSGDLTPGVAALKRYVDTNPPGTDALLQLGALALRTGAPSEAFAAASRALGLDPGDARCHLLLAEATTHLYGSPKAIELMQARAQKGAEPAAVVGAAYAYVLGGQPGEALAELAGAAETDRTAAAAAYVRGLAKNALGLHAEAASELSRAASEASAPTDFRAALASALALAGRPEDALWEYADLLGDPASEPRGLSGIRTLLAAGAVANGPAVEALRRAGMDHRPTQALLALLNGPLARQTPAVTTAALRDIAEAWPGSERAWKALADAYQQQGLADQEALVLTHIIDMRPGDVSYPLWLAGAYERAGRLSRAADAYAMALAIDPSNRQAASGLERLSRQEGGPPAPNQQPTPGVPRLPAPPSLRAAATGRSEP